MDKIIACKNIQKNFGAGETIVRALKDVDLEVDPKELLMLVGPSGSGKTTLLSIIAGILSQDAGACLIQGSDMSQMEEKQRIAFRGDNIGFVFQSFNLIPTLTSVENVAVPLLIKGVSREEAYQIAHDLLEKLGLESKYNRFPKELSGGEMQRVSIARGCIHKPSLILCDEPTSFLDQETGTKVMELLKSIQEETGCTLVIVTHDPRILKYATRMAKIDDGKILPFSLDESKEQ